MNSILTKHQVKEFTKQISYDGKPRTITVTLRYDDQCNNGHNSFSITGAIYKKGKQDDPEVCGCIHDEIRKHFPEFAKYIKWHLTSSDSPMYYIENSMYWLGFRGYCNGDKRDPPNYDHFRSTAVWQEISDSEIKMMTEWQMTDALNDRLPALMAEFKRDMEEIGFIF